MSRERNTLGPIVGYHGCSREVAEKVLAGTDILKKSENDYDWLGPGIYFWVDSADRAWEWAELQKASKGWDETAVVGAFIHPGLCLNLTDFGVNESMVSAYNMLSAAMGDGLPTNESPQNGILMRRGLDCAVITAIHNLRKKSKPKLPDYDTVYGVFEEGKALYPGSGFREKTHVQLAVCNPKSIIGYFRVK